MQLIHLESQQKSSKDTICLFPCGAGPNHCDHLFLCPLCSSLRFGQWNNNMGEFSINYSRRRWDQSSAVWSVVFWTVTWRRGRNLLHSSCWVEPGSCRESLESSALLQPAGRWCLCGTTCTHTHTHTHTHTYMTFSLHFILKTIKKFLLSCNLWWVFVFIVFRLNK